MSSLIFFEKNKCRLADKVYSCAFGRGGTVLDKKEGDGGTPVGTFPLRQVFYRPDRVAPPVTALAIQPLTPAMGWCDETANPLYNQLVWLPYAGRHEVLWRADHVYDLILVIGYNDEPVIPGKGSAIFIHLARKNYPPTEGCLAFNQADLREILAYLTLNSTVTINYIK